MNSILVYVKPNTRIAKNKNCKSNLSCLLQTKRTVYTWLNLNGTESGSWKTISELHFWIVNVYKLTNIYHIFISMLACIYHRTRILKNIMLIPQFFTINQFWLFSLRTTNYLRIKPRLLRLIESNASTNWIREEYRLHYKQ